MTTRITVISSMATRQLLADLAAAWQRQHGADVHVESVGGVDAAKRVLAGEAFDLVVLASDAMAKLAAAGRIVAGSVRDLARSTVAIAVPQGSAPPDVSTEAALRAAVLAAPRIGYSTGPSGDALQTLVARWGILDDIRPRMVQAPPGIPVGALLARGEADLGFQQLGELMHVEGITVIGPMPPGLAIVTTFSGAVCTAASRPEAARAWLDFIRSPAADEAKHRHGMAPA